MSPNPRVLTVQLLLAGTSLQAAKTDQARLSFPLPLQGDLRGQQEHSVLAGHLCMCDQQC